MDALTGPGLAPLSPGARAASRSRRPSRRASSSATDDAVRIHFLDWDGRARARDRPPGPPPTRPGVLLVHGLAPDGLDLGAGRASAAPRRAASWPWTSAATASPTPRPSGYEPDTAGRRRDRGRRGSGLLPLAGRGAGRPVRRRRPSATGRSWRPGRRTPSASAARGLVLVDGGWEDSPAPTGATPEEWLAGDRGAAGGARLDGRLARRPRGLRPADLGRGPGARPRGPRSSRRRPAGSSSPSTRTRWRAPSRAMWSLRAGRGPADRRGARSRRCVARTSDGSRTRAALGRPCARAPPGTGTVARIAVAVVPGRGPQPRPPRAGAPWPAPGCAGRRRGLRCRHDRPAAARARPLDRRRDRDRDRRGAAPRIPTPSSRPRPSRAARAATPATPTGGSRPPSARSSARSARTPTARASSARPAGSTGCTPS